MLRKSLRWRVGISYIGLFILAMIGLNLFLSWFVRQTYLSNLRTYLVNENMIVAQEAGRLYAAFSNAQPWNDLAGRYARLLDVRVTLILADGRVAGESFQPAELDEYQLNYPEVSAALSGKKAVENRYSMVAQQELMFSAVPIMEGERIIGVARLAISLTDVNASINAISTTILVAALITTLVIIFLAFLLTNYTTRPLRQLTQKVLGMTGDPSQKQVELTASDEVGQLELAFDQLAGQLQAQIAELSGERSKLEAVLTSMADGVVIVDAKGKIGRAHV